MNQSCWSRSFSSTKCLPAGSVRWVLSCTTVRPLQWSDSSLGSHHYLLLTGVISPLISWNTAHIEIDFVNGFIKYVSNKTFIQKLANGTTHKALSGCEQLVSDMVLSCVHTKRQANFRLTLLAWVWAAGSFVFIRITHTGRAREEEEGFTSM